MQCAHKDKKGKRCLQRMPGRTKFCFLHDPKKLPIVFVKNFGLYEKDFLETDLPVDLAEGYVALGAAKKVDEKMWRKMMRAVTEGMVEYEKQLATPLKWWVKKKDILAIWRFFGETKMVSKQWMENLIRNDVLTDEERTFIRSVMDPFAKTKKK